MDRLIHEFVDVDPEQMKRAHENLSQLSKETIRDLLESAFDDAPPSTALYLDDAEIHSVDRGQDSEHENVSEKEIASGDAIVWWAVQSNGGGDSIEQADVQYGIHIGKDSDGLFYDRVEVTVTRK